MMISTKGRYALRTMIDIGLHEAENSVTLKDISQREEISMKYLEQVVSMLVKAGLLIGTRGSKGGYRLSRSADQYTVYDIVLATEGTLAPVQCLKDSENRCKRCGECASVGVWNGLYSQVSSYLKSVTLQELIEKVLDDRKGSDYGIDR